MCLIAFAYKVHPDYPLMIIANRDEHYLRPTREAKFWVEEGHPEILAGKDLEAGGTWMGISKNGKWAALTNYRDPELLDPSRPTRGTLVMNYLKSEMPPKEYLTRLKNSGIVYNPFNLLAGTMDEVFHYSNINSQITKVTPGIHGVSNALLDTSWPKLENAKSGLEKECKTKEPSKSNLFELLANMKKAPQDQLPQTGVAHNLEWVLSSIFVHWEDYGTRCSTILTCNRQGTVDFTERRFISGSQNIEGESHFNFNLE